MILWFVLSRLMDVTVQLKYGDVVRLCSSRQIQNDMQVLTAGEHCHIHLLDIQLQTGLPVDTWIEYKLIFENKNGVREELCAGFYVASTLSQVAHGSCRRPHTPCGDGLVALQERLETQEPKDWPSLLVMTGDQVYVDDVSGPMLQAVHQLIPHLGIADEALPLADMRSSELHSSVEHYYQRDQLLPDVNENDTVIKTFFGGIRKPIFTTVHGGNHLMSFAEVIAMYLLSWSAKPWVFVHLRVPEGLGEFQERYERDLPIIQAFADGLAAVERLLARIPVAMIFDDHDVTDDWNLSYAWEEAAYNNDLAHRIIGNAVLAYFLCQGWGNEPNHFDERFCGSIQSALLDLGEKKHKECISMLLHFRGWGYEWPTEPGLVVIDSRTNRWRSEGSKYMPSGLMDWESITDLQNSLKDRDSVLLISPAPIFGVKLIEVVQKIFTFVGKPLMVDAENWMAHRGAAYALMNLFRHPKTPENFVILSGDVHYSFAYRVKLRGYDGGPSVWQITSSGIKNEFPPKLLDVLDRLNRWLYAPWSPLNWLTKRKRMHIDPFRPDGASRGERLLNSSGIGLVTLEEGRPVKIMHLSAQGQLQEFLKEG